MSKFGKYLLLATGFATLAIVGTRTNGASKALAFIPGAVINVHAHDRGCSVASLKGPYAFRRTGVNNVVGGPIAVIGIEFFNGDGTHRVTRSTSSGPLKITDWTDPPGSGIYTVDPDCTGSFLDENGARTNNFVVFDGGKRYFLMSLAPGTIVTAEAERLEVED
jgi:hypothetical protein